MEISHSWYSLLFSLHTLLFRGSKHSVAIKIIDKEKLKGKEGMMVNEIKIMRGLNHDHCVKLVSHLKNI